MESSVRIQYLAGGEIQFAAYSSHDAVRHVLRSSEPADGGDALCYELFVFLPDTCGHICKDDAGPHLKDGDSAFCKTVCKQLCDHGDTRLGDTVFPLFTEEV